MRSWLALICCCLLPACDSSQPDSTRASKVLATIDGRPITVDAFRAEMERRTKSAPGRLATPEQRRALLDEIIRFEVLYAQARKAGYDRDPEILESLRKMVAGKFREDQLIARARTAKVTDAEIEAHYQKHRGKFTIPAKSRVAVIRIRVPSGVQPEQRARLRDRAVQVRARAVGLPAGTRGFGDLAREFSDDQASRYQGGDIGWVAAGATNSRWPPNVIADVEALGEVGEVSPIVESPGGLYILRLMERRAERLRPLEEIRSSLLHTLATRKRREIQTELENELRNKTAVEVDEDLLEALSVPEGVALGGPMKSEG